MAQNPVSIQKQIRENALEVNAYLKDLNEWTTDVMAQELAEKLSDDNSDISSIPIRGKAQDNKESHETTKNETMENNNNFKKSKRIIGSDYSAWDKFDADEACKEVEMTEEAKPLEEEEIVRKKAKELRQKSLVNMKKELGNKCMQQKDYKMAIEYYSTAMALDPNNVILPANRAQAYLNINEYNRALIDCDTAIKIDPTFVKAFFRRARAKIAIGDSAGAQIDLRKTLDFDPNNKEARKMLGDLEKSHRSGLAAQRGGNNINKLANYYNKSQEEVKKPVVKYPKIVHPISKPPHLQSKRSLFSVYVKIKGEEKENKIRRLDSTSSSNWSSSNGISSSPFASIETTPSTSNICSPNADLNELNLLDSFETMRVGSIAIPEKPKTSVEFISHWKQLKPYSTSAAQYLLQMKAEDYLMFQDTMESSILSDILDTLVWEFIPRNWDYTDNLEGLTKVRRLKTLILFLTEKDRANARKLISLCPKKELQDFYLSNYNF